jgi:hypothetical protein
MQTDRRHINTKSRIVSRSTPIPPRASAHPEAVVKVQPRYPRTYQAPTDDDITRHPTTPSPVMWQYETSHYVAESSLASLSLFTPQQTPCPPSVAAPSIDALDTQPSVASMQHRKRPETDVSSRDLADVDTAPPAIAKLRTKQAIEIADMPTVPPGAHRPHRSGQRLSSFASQPPYSTEHELFHSAQTLVSNESRRSLRFNPFDRLRWWLLYPGRLESLLWSGGVILLVGITVLLSVATVLSLTASHTSQADSTPRSALRSASEPTFCSASSATNSNMQKCVIATAASPDGLQISLFSTGPFMAGTTVHLQGHGFSPSGRVVITHDANQPCQPGIVQVDQHGDFNLVLSLRNNLGWLPGNRALMVEDTASGHRVMLAFILCTGKN